LANWTDGPAIAPERAGMPLGSSGIQSPSPGSAEKYFSNLPCTPSNSFASAGGSFLVVRFGHLSAYSVLTSSHFSSPGSVSGLMASAGH